MKKFFPIVAFIAVALISLTMAGFAYFATQEASRIKFEATADDALNRIESRIDLHLSLLRSTQALFDARNGEISQSEFKAFFNALDIDNNFAGLRGIGFLGLVKTATRRRSNATSCTIYGTSHAGLSGHDAALAHAHHAVRAAGPVQPGQHRLRHVQRTGAARGDREGDGRSTSSTRAGCVQLGQGTGATQTFTGFLVFVRLNVETAPEVINASRSSTAGFLYAAFRARDLFQIALSRAPLLPVNTEVYDGAVNSDNLLFRSETPPASSFGDRLLVTRKITVAGRPWTRPVQADQRLLAAVVARHPGDAGRCSACCWRAPSRWWRAIRSAPMRRPRSCTRRPKRACWKRT